MEKTVLPKHLAEQHERMKQAITELRERNFRNNLPFLILSDDLPAFQSYYEYGDGRVEIRELIERHDGYYDTKLVRVLPENEAVLIRENAIQ